MKYDVFISYSRKDTTIADKICQVFDNQDPAISYFIDRQGIEGSAEFPEILAKAIEDSSIVLFLGSANSYQSDYTKKEVSYTINKKGGTALFPLILDNSPMPYSIELQLSNINWRILGRSYSIEENLVTDIRKKLQDPHAGETFEVRKQKKDYKILVGAICSFCIILGASLYFMLKDNGVKTQAIQSSELAAMHINSADSLLAIIDVLKSSENEESRITEELQLLNQAAAHVHEAQMMKNEYIGTEYLPLFLSDSEGKSRVIEMKKDSMYAEWSARAQDAYRFYRQVGSISEKVLAERYANFALLIRPDDEKMITLKEKTNSRK